MNIFDDILKEAIEESSEETPETEGAFSKTDETETPKEEETVEEPPKEDEETLEEPEVDEDTPQSQLRDICFEILNIMESSALADGDDNLEEEESVDVCCELLAKFADRFDDEVCYGMIKILSDYFDIEAGARRQ